MTEFAGLMPASSVTPELLEPLRRHRVGGTYWAAQPEIPVGSILVRCRAAIHAAQQMFSGRPIIMWDSDARRGEQNRRGVILVSGECDPWHMLSFAEAVVTEPDDEIRQIAALTGVERHVYDLQTGEVLPDPVEAATLLEGALPEAVANPFTGEPMRFCDAVELCGFWRRLIDSNRGFAGGLGFAFWKQEHVAPLLWDGGRPFPFLRDLNGVEDGSSVAAWCAKTRPELLADVDRRAISIVEVEDGFLRSRGLGADCIPPLSITVDRLGPCFDPARPSELEQLLEDGAFDEKLLERARELRRLLVARGIAKYEQGREILQRPAGARRHILVPGQVEDDRAVQAGGCGLVANLDLLQRVRAEAPDAYILYKAHPDVLAGHRRGAIARGTCLQFADEIVGEVPIASVIDMVDEVHVNTSLAGFETLLRGKAVTTYGVPFYAGWGLTRDLGPVPQRRTARRTLDELVAAVLLVYPRYLDPVTGLPCPAEVVVRRLSAGEDREPGLLVGMRRLQGKLKLRLRSLVQ
jgi:capsular polysaccharide export protein